nr:3,2-trans-enoyl-coa isomerase [Quercus suber]POE87651.1 3,2-trans-enoyl-coa isomerase [Quercus suber]
MCPGCVHSFIGIFRGWNHAAVAYNGVLSRCRSLMSHDPPHGRPLHRINVTVAPVRPRHAVDHRRYESWRRNAPLHDKSTQTYYVKSSLIDSLSRDVLVRYEYLFPALLLHAVEQPYGIPVGCRDIIGALRELNAHPDTTFTVITGEGRFFAAGADVNNIAAARSDFRHDGERKVFWAQRFTEGMELVRSLIEHRKVVVLALNGPAVGAGAAWFQGCCDLFYAAEGAWLHVTFSQLGLVPENGSAFSWAQSLGTHRANEWLMFGGKASVEELRDMGLVNRVFPKERFHEQVHDFLKEMLRERDGKSMMEMKRLQNAPTRDARIVALYDSMHALGERFVEGEPLRRMTAKMEELKGELHFEAICCTTKVLTSSLANRARKAAKL